MRVAKRSSRRYLNCLDRRNKRQQHDFLTGSPNGWLAVDVERGFTLALRSYSYICGTIERPDFVEVRRLTHVDLLSGAI